jgi:hypothetical protein
LAVVVLQQQVLVKVLTAQIQFFLRLLLQVAVVLVALLIQPLEMVNQVVQAAALALVVLLALLVAQVQQIKVMQVEITHLVDKALVVVEQAELVLGIILGV